MSNRSVTRRPGRVGASAARLAGTLRAVALAILVGGCVGLAVLVGGCVGTFAAAPGALADESGSSGEPVTVRVPQHSMPPANASLACTGAGGAALGNNPTLHPGDQISCKGIGYTAGEQVSVTLSPPTQDLGTVTAGLDDVAQRDISLPGGLGAGAHTITFTGRSSHRTASFAFTVTIVATVPVGGGTGGEPTGEPSTEPSGGWLPRTGVDVLGLIGAGAALVIVGALAVAAGRRRVRRGAVGRQDVLPGGERA